ncbi:hypothetical protein O181_047297 [Austropuccinia psidii MF-1]|uniref:Helitron helicase-like domain-containing protein n=1 Tax=Austropuccinia psidii MF-1 TaxID=1389203 RepID=A0A9Q3HKH6_9BASI|nr:hypothetical protein [Austropuccinia psidii MF-1]
MEDLHPFLHELFLSESKRTPSYLNSNLKKDADKVQGQLYHNIGSIFPDKPQDAKFAQIFVVGDSDVGEACHRLTYANSKVDATIILDWQKYLNRFNPYAKIYRSAKEIIGGDVRQTFALRSLEGKTFNLNKYNKPTANEIAMVMTDSARTKTSRDIVLHRIGGRLQHIQDHHSGYLALWYAVLFPHGEQHWHPNYSISNMKRPVGKISQTEWYAYLLFDRPGMVFLPLHSKRLYQEFVVDLYICIESSRLRYIRSNQRQLKVDIYQGITETLENEGHVV